MTAPDTPSTSDTAESTETAETIRLFNDAFRRRDTEAMAALVHDDCLMVSAQPAPDGTAYVGKKACVDFWAELMTDEASTFEVEHVFSAGDWATVRWRYRFGPADAESVLGVNVTRVSNGRVIEQLGYTKVPGGLPLPE
ncbi:SnoaL-like protein [Kribbella steppae]|uniref:SnoaL-like protein n=1 Tax=Kribbella steppae TaxID=2512223 RepID=A0A4R2HK60_9ACTN|nr:nuclear transport factor 2 family protein [Kribbella steppae]TCO30223.1 SnoaL-like protein [Kribbella steppae]